MNEFEYTLQLEKLKTLTTKSDKVNFIRKVKRKKLTTIYDFKLIKDILNILTPDITGYRSLAGAISHELITANLTLKELESLRYPMSTIQSPKAYHDFMESAGIPINYKIAILKCIEEEKAIKIVAKNKWRYYEETK